MDEHRIETNPNKFQTPYVASSRGLIKIRRAHRFGTKKRSKYVKAG